MVDALTITYIWGGGLIAFMIVLMVFLSIVYSKLKQLSTIVNVMQKNMNENANQETEFHIRRPNQIIMDSNNHYNNSENPKGFPAPVQNQGKSKKQSSMQNDDYRFGSPQPQPSSLLGVPGKREGPKPPPKNVNPQNDNYFSSNYSEEPFRNPQGNYLSDEMFRKTSQMTPDNYAKNNPSRTRSNLDNNNFFY